MHILRNPSKWISQFRNFNPIGQLASRIFVRHDRKLRFKLCALRQYQIDLCGRRQRKNLKTIKVPGQHIQCVGANGTGKSTLIAAIAGDIPPESGQITINQLSIETLKREELARLRSVAAQSHTYWMAYTTNEILRLGNDDISEERFNYLVTKLGIDSYLEQNVTTLSGGQSQRIEIARALMREIPIVLLDEPFASQDLASISVIMTYS